MKHNKKRNCGLLYEFLARYVAEGIVDSDEARVRRGVKVLKRFYREGTELHREFRLVRALLDSGVGADRGTATRIIETARSAARSVDVVRLDREKSLLIRSINHTLSDPMFYDRQIESYRIHATVQMLLDEWRRPVPTDVVRAALLEEELIEHLMKPKANNILDEARMDVDDLIVNLMVKRVDAKYRSVMSSDQVALMEQYVYSMKSGSQEALTATIEKLRLETIASIDRLAASKSTDPQLVGRLAEVRSLIQQPVAVVDDAVLARYLRIVRLKQEMAG